MQVKFPEEHKKPGVCYAVTDEGVELPVIDVTHPAFIEQIDEATVDRVIAGTIESMKRVMQLPAAEQQAMRDRSILMRVMVEAADTFMSGMATYLYKLGPCNLGAAYASDLDRAIAAGITPLSMRSRLRHMARMMADSLVPLLSSRRGPLHLVNIAGGTAMDSLNALILLWKEHEEAFTSPWNATAGSRTADIGYRTSDCSRDVRIHVLDTDIAGASFAARALDALQRPGGPLHGLSANLVRVDYDWREPATLACLLRDIASPDAVIAGSSEGGLFEYPTDEQMVANLAGLRDGTPDDCVLVGTIVRDTTTIDPRMAPMEAMKGRPTIRFIGVNAFRTIAERAGWRITAVADEAIHHVVRLEKGQHA